MQFEYHKARDREDRNLPRPYNLDYPVEFGYAKSKHRALVIIEHVSSNDLRQRSLLGDDITRQSYLNVLEYAHELAANYGARDKYKHAFINFNYLKHYDLTPDLQESVGKLATERVRKYIEDLDPTLIIIVGDYAAECITGNRSIRQQRGWVHRYNGVPLVNTIDFDRAYSPPNDQTDDMDEEAVIYANILGYVARNISHGFIGRHPHDLSSIKARSKLVDTIPKFDRLLRRMRKAVVQAHDTEGTSLFTSDNRFQTLQVSFSTRRAYIVPLMHKDGRWTPQELEYVRTSLRDFYAMRVRQYHGERTQHIVGQNFGYDLRVLMRWLGVRYCYWPIYDLMSGEHSLDENIKVLQTYGTPAFNLAQMFRSYCNTFYDTNEFSKGDRTRVAEIELTGAALRYMAMDTQSAMGIYHMQRARAEKMPHMKGNYRESHLRLNLTVRSSMVKMMSVMRYRGTQVDIPYLMGLLKPNSEITVRLRETNEELYQLAEVKLADDQLRKAKNLPTKSWMGGGKAARVFDITKAEHKKILFVDILKLEPLRVGKSGEPSFDKFFLKEYAKDNRAAALVQSLNGLSKLKSSYIDAFFRHIANNADSAADQRIRPEFGYVDVVTGRSNSSKPSLQQIPEHSADAKIIKRMFITAPMHLAYAADYSAHEVRCIHLDMWVETERGRFQLKTLIAMANPPRAKSFNHHTNQVEYQPIDFKSIHATEQKMMEIEYEGGSIMVTEDHEVWSNTRNAYVKAKDIQDGEGVLIDA